MHILNKIFITLGVAVIIFAVGFIFYLNYSVLFNSSAQQESTFSLEQERNTIGNKVPFLDPIKIGLVGVDTLDSNLKKLIPAGATAVEITQVTYPDKSKGFEITYSINTNLYTSHKNSIFLANSFPYKVLIASRGNLFSVISAESLQYKIKISSESTEENQTRAEILIQIK